MFDAYTDRDAETLKAIVGQVPASEAVNSLLAAMNVLTGVFAMQLQTTPANVTDRVRRRVIREIADAAPRTPKRKAS